MRGLRLMRVHGGPRGAVGGPRTEARPLGLIRRDFLLQGCDHGVGGLRTVELQRGTEKGVGLSPRLSESTQLLRVTRANFGRVLRLGTDR